MYIKLDSGYFALLLRFPPYTVSLYEHAHALVSQRSREVLCVSLSRIQGQNDRETEWRKENANLEEEIVRASAVEGFRIAIQHNN